MSKKQDKRWKHRAAAIRLAWASLETHLPYTHQKCKDGSRKFHAKCVREYVDLMLHIIKSAD